ncbi:hypothetical protein Tco_0948130, partial [Tanacetum coccineum]
IIMAQQQHAADVHPDELCPPNKRYDLMDANKKEDRSKYSLTFILDKKELSLTLDDFRTIFHLLQANADNHDSFVTPPSFINMVPFYKQQLGFIMELKTSSSFKTTGLLQPWKMLSKIYSKCLTTRVTGWDQPPLQIMQMMEIQRQSWNENSRLDDFRRNEAHGALSDVCEDTLQVSLAEHKSREEQEARENVELVKEHLASVEIEKMVEGSKNVIDDSLLHRNDEPKILGTRLEPRSDKESSKVEITNDKEVEITNDEEVEITSVVIPVNVNKADEEITAEVYELKRREKGKIVEEFRSIPFPIPIRSPRIHTDLVSSNTEKFQELTITDTKTTPLSRLPSTNLSKTNQLLSLFKAKPARFKQYKNFFQELQGQVMVESLPTMVDTHIKEQVKKQVPEQVEISSQIHKAIDNHIPSQVDALVRSYMSGHILHVHPVQSQTPYVLEQQYQLYLSMKFDPQFQQQDIAIWLALQMKFKSLQGENHAKRQKTYEYEVYVSRELSSGQVNENEQGPLTSGNQEQEDDYDFWTESYASDDDEIPTKQMTIDEEKLKKMVDEIWVNKCVKKFNPYAKYGVEHWKNPYVKIFYIRKQKEPKKPKEVIYSNSKIIQVIKTYWELGHEHKFITEIVARRANECIVSITEPDYKNLNKNDIEDMYLLIMNGKVPDYAETWLLWSLSVFIRSSVIRERVHDFQLGIESYQQKVNLTTPTISFPGIEKYKMFSIIYELVHGIIYKNSKKEKRVMRHSEIHKFCDATLNRVLEGLRSYNNWIYSKRSHQ